MRKFAIAGMAALAIAASTAVYANQGWFREHMQHMRLSPEDRAALLDARAPGLDPALQDLQLGLARPLFARRGRHLALLNANEQVGSAGLTWRYQGPADEQITVEHEPEAPLRRLAAAVTACAVGLQDCLGLLAQRHRSIGQRRRRPQGEAGRTKKPQESLHHRPRVVPPVALLPCLRR